MILVDLKDIFAMQAQQGVPTILQNNKLLNIETKHMEHIQNIQDVGKVSFQQYYEKYSCEILQIYFVAMLSLLMCFGL